MKKWDSPVIEEMELKATASTGGDASDGTIGQYQNKNHKGKCAMRWNSKATVCTCN